MQDGRTNNKLFRVFAGTSFQDKDSELVQVIKGYFKGIASRK